MRWRVGQVLVVGMVGERGRVGDRWQSQDRKKVFYGRSGGIELGFQFEGSVDAREEM